jgi:hypothetical protein
VTLPDEGDIEWEVSPIVYIEDEGVFGIIVSYGAFVSRVKYMKDGTLYDVLIENEEFTNGD